MKNTISISTGLVYKFTSDRNQMIEILREFSPDGIEISFADPDYLLNFKISDKNIKYLRSLSYVTIHAPWKNIRYGNNENTTRVLSTLQDLYHTINAKNITVEPGEIDDYKIFEKYNCKFSIENADYRKEYKYINEISSVFKRNGNFDFTFDFAHALTIFPDQIEEFLCEKQLKQVHLSYFDRELSDHSFLCKHSFEEISFKIKMIPEDIPLVLECVAETEDQIKWIDEEINYLREL